MTDNECATTSYLASDPAHSAARAKRACWSRSRASAFVRATRSAMCRRRLRALVPIATARSAPIVMSTIAQRTWASVTGAIALSGAATGVDVPHPHREAHRERRCGEREPVTRVGGTPRPRRARGRARARSLRDPGRRERATPSAVTATAPRSDACGAGQGRNAEHDPGQRDPAVQGRRHEGAVGPQRGRHEHHGRQARQPEPQHDDDVHDDRVAHEEAPHGPEPAGVELGEERFLGRGHDATCATTKERMALPCHPGRAMRCGHPAGTPEVVRRPSDA